MGIDDMKIHRVSFGKSICSEWLIGGRSILNITTDDVDGGYDMRFCLLHVDAIAELTNGKLRVFTGEDRVEIYPPSGTVVYYKE